MEHENCRYHSLHHTQFRTNYSLFMPLYDYIYGTMDESTDTLYEKTLERGDDIVDVVHLTHLTTPESIYHLRIGLASFASYPFAYRWFMRLLWPFTSLSMIFTLFYARLFVAERNSFNKLNLQSWVIPRYNLQVLIIIIIIIIYIGWLTCWCIYINGDIYMMHAVLVKMEERSDQ